MRDTNREKGVVYGFATTGEDWQMVTYDGNFQLTEKFSVMFPRMRESKEKWIKEFSVIVDLMYIALEEGGGGYVVGSRELCDGIFNKWVTVEWSAWVLAIH